MADTERWQRIEELFGSALELPAEERQAFLARATTDDATLLPEVLALLAADDRGGQFLEQPATPTGAVRDRAAAERIGPYRLIRRLGEGGMSRVHLAVRDDDEYQKMVAVKVIRHGMDRDDLLRRFRTERQILAVLDHPNIARLLDGGHTDDGLPYFVMDYVEGIPIDEYCDRNRLTVARRLALFRIVCGAVQYAHQNLVVHRDIKPSNILVTADGDPKLLDFGIAKLLKPEQFPVPVELTATRIRPMTPYFASPEQIRGEPITTSSDVYSLGVLLYKLLTGRLPYRLSGGGAREVEEAVVEQPPEPPSTAITRAETEMDGPGTEAIGRFRGATAQQLRRQLTGDLENIVLNTLRKEPTRRYASAEQLSADLGRHLSKRPVLAHRDSLGYRAKKFLTRNRITVTVASAFVLLLIAFAAAMALQAARIAEERDRAARERDQSEEVVAFLQDIFQQSDPFTAGEEAIIAREFLDRGAERIARDLERRPEIQATLMEAIGNVYRNLDLFDSAEPLLRQALAIRRETLGNDHPRTAQSLSSLARLLHETGNYTDAEPLILEALALRRRLGGERSAQVAGSLHDLGRLKFATGQYREAEELYREALRIRRQDERQHLEIAQQLTDLSILLARTGDFSEAESLLREALDLRRRELGAAHPLVADSLNNLGVVLGYQGKSEDAETLFRETLAVRLELFGEDSQHVAESLANLARSLRGRGDLEGAEAMYRQSVATYARVLGADHPLTADVANNLAYLLKDRGDLAGAEDVFRQTLDGRRRRLGDHHKSVGDSLLGLGELLLFKGEPEAGEPILREALDIFQASLPEGHWRTAASRSLIGGCLAAQGRFENGEPMALAGYRDLAEARGAENRHTREALERVIELYEAWGKGGQAAEYRAFRGAAK